MLTYQMDLCPIIDQSVSRTSTTRSTSSMGIRSLAILHFDDIDLGVFLAILRTLGGTR